MELHTGAHQPALAVVGDTLSLHRVASRVSAFIRTDAAAVALLLAFGLTAIVFYERSADFLGEDVFYADAARTLLSHGYYGINGHVETNQPPGLSVLLAGLFSIFGYSHTASVISNAVLETLGFLLCYAILRQRMSQMAAGAICVLLMSSRISFVWATRLVYPCYPYMFAAAVALLAGEQCQRASSPIRRAVWSVAFALSVAVSLMVASAAMAFLGAMFVVIFATALKDRRLAWTRLRVFLPALLIGIAVQGLWMRRPPAPLEWPLPGYPAPYLEQLKVKVGNYPELGMATIRDLPVRFFDNVIAQSDLLAQIVLRHGVNLSKIAVAIVPALAILLGWCYSVWEAAGTGLLEWYFAGYEFIYLLWPWRLEARFLLPVAPFACLYVWKGMEAALVAARARPRLTGMIWCPIATALTILGAHWIVTHWQTGFGDLPDELLVPVYLLAAAVAAWMTLRGRTPAFLSADGTKPGNLGWRSALRYSALATIVLLVVIGTVGEVAVARENYSLSRTSVLGAALQLNEITAPEIEAAQWIRKNTPPDSVIMARHLPTVYHYSGRRAVWFPPSTNRQVLLEGIVKHQVDYVVVITHRNPYYLPDDDACFQPLLQTYGDVFQIVFQDSNLRVFRVVREGAHNMMREDGTALN